MSPLYLPPGVTRQMADARAANEAVVLSHVETTQKVKHWNRELRRIDPYVEIVKAHDTARHPALKAGYYHILRRPPVGHPAIIVHQGPNGEFRDLDSGIFETLRAGDMWNSERQRENKRLHREAKRAQERAEEREAEERVDEIMDRLRARVSPGVRVPRSI